MTDHQKLNMILEGVVTMTDIDGDISTCDASAESDTAYFGELALMKNAPRACNVTAKTDCKCLALNRADFLKMLGPLEDIMNANFCFGVFKNLKIFEGVPQAVIKNAAAKCVIEDFEPGKDIITQGDSGGWRPGNLHRCAYHRRDQQGSRRRGEAGSIPGRPVLSTQRHPHNVAAAAGTQQ